MRAILCISSRKGVDVHGVVVGARREAEAAPGRQATAHGGTVTLRPVGARAASVPRGRVEVGRDVYFDGSIVETDGEGGGSGGVSRGRRVASARLGVNFEASPAARIRPQRRAIT